MDERKVYGQYIVGRGGNFKVKPNDTGFGYERNLVPDAWYIIHITGKVLGTYSDETLAHNLAKGLDKRDQQILAEEMEKILVQRGD